MPSAPLPTPDHADDVTTRHELVAYIERLRESIESGHPIENVTSERFLTALASWISSAPGFYLNTGRPLTEEATWSFFAHALSAALIYE